MGLQLRSRTLTRDTAPSPPPPAAFGRFRVVHQVGAGAYGPVFLATDPDTGRQVAIKVFPLAITPEQAADLAAAFEQLAASPLGHPSIVAPIAAGAEGSTVYLVEDYVLAESVDVAIRQYGPAPVPDALRLIGQLAGALDFAAVAGVHHGALHPRDVLVAPNDVRLTGIGVVEALGQVGVRVGPRRPYSAPERHEDGPWGVPADVFSLATLGFELLTGRRPGSPDAVAADTRSIAAPEPGVLAEVFTRALAPRPEDRYQTALSFAAALRHALTGEPIERLTVAPLPVEPHAADAGPEPAHDAIDEAPADTAVGEAFHASVVTTPPVANPDEGMDLYRQAEEAGEPEPEVEVEEEETPPVEEPAAGPIELGDVEEASGPRELGEEARGGEAGDELLLPLDPVAVPPPPPVMRYEDEEPAPARVPPTPAPVPPPSISAHQADWRTAGPRPPIRRASSGRFGLSSLLAMLLIGVLAGFTVGYLTGVREPVGAPEAAAAPAEAPADAEGDGSAVDQAPGGEAAATPDQGASAAAPGPVPSGGDPTISKGQPVSSEAATGEPAAATPPAAASRAPSTPAAGPAPARPPERRATRFEAPLAIVSRPPGALVRLDGRAVGKTPLNMSAVGAGSHVVRLELDGYLPWSSAIQVVSGQQNRVTASLERRSGRIE